MSNGTPYLHRPSAYESPTPYDEGRIRAAAVYCSDGRIGEQVDDLLHEGLGLPRYDRLAVPGGPVALAGRFAAGWEARGVEEQLRFLVRVHGLEQIVLIAHQDCAYYRQRLQLPERSLLAEQQRDLERAAAAVRKLDGALSLSAFFALLTRDRVRFEPFEV